MVNTKFIGRLGNSMFQISACIGYAKKYGYQWGVPNDQRESTILTHFPNLPRCNDVNNRYHEHPSRFCDIHKTHYDQCHFNYHAIPDLGPNVTLTGFYQSYKYFEGADEEIKKVFKLEHVSGYEDCVSVHVRRGDYVMHSGSFPPVTKEYILNAMQSFLDKNPITKFVIFSDDINWCKENIKLHMHSLGNDEQEIELNKKLLDAMIEYSEGRNELQDLSLMASCGHHIIANSTFSWWGSFLGHNPNKIIISPSHKRGNWFGHSSGIKQDCIDLIPPTWHQIEFR